MNTDVLSKKCFSMCDDKSSLSKKEINAIKNVLSGTISVEHCSLTSLKQKQLVLAANIFLEYPSEFYLDSRLNDFFDSMMGSKHVERDLRRTKVYYELIKDLVNDGEKLVLKKFRISRISKISNVLEKVQPILPPQELTNDDYKERYKELVLSLIEQQEKDAKAYFDSCEPYNDHVRRYSYSTENQYKSKDMFISELQNIYGDLYDYSSVEYKNRKTKVSLFCKKHNLVFQRTPANLLKGYGCPCCNEELGRTWKNTVGITYLSERRNLRWDTDRFIKESEYMFGKGTFDYSKCHYVNSKTPVTLIQTSTGKEFSARPYEHLRHGDYRKTESKYYEGTTDEQKIYYYVDCIRRELTDKVYVPMQHIESYKRFKCICPIHGEFFTNLINIHKGIGCPDCTPKGESLGERAVRIYLQHKGVEYIQEYNVQDKQYFDTFARIDFYIPEKNMFIEFQGEQHYNIAASKIMHNSRGWQKQKKRDNHLRAYAKSKGISLVEIPYTYRNNVSGFLDKYFQ